MIGPSILISSAQPAETAARRFLRFGRALSQQENETGWHVGFEVFFSHFSRKTRDTFHLFKVPNYQIIQVLTTRLSRC